MNMNIAALDGFSLRLIETLVHFVWQGAALALLAVMATVVLRRASSRLRYSVLLAIFAAMAVSPVVTFAIWVPPSKTTVPSSNAWVPPSSAPALGGAASEEAAASSAHTAPPRPEGLEGGSQVEPTVPAGVEDGTLSSSSHTSHDSHASHPSQSPILARLAANYHNARTFTETHAPWLLLAYTLGVALMLLRLAWAVRGGRRLRRHCLHVEDPALLEKLREQAKLLGLRAAPVVAYCERVMVPTVIGIFRPMILLPLFMATGFTPEQLELILRHELAHIRRYDQLINIIQRIVEAFLFFHPGVWYVSRLIRIEREHCCDDLVLATGGEALAYADSLVRIAERGLGKEPVAAVTMAARPSDLRRRIIRLLEGPAPHVRFSRMGLLLVLVLLAASGAAIYAATGDGKDGKHGKDGKYEVAMAQPEEDAEDQAAPSSDQSDKSDVSTESIRRGESTPSTQPPLDTLSEEEIAQLVDQFSTALYWVRQLRGGQVSRSDAEEMLRTLASALQLPPPAPPQTIPEPPAPAGPQPPVPEGATEPKITIQGFWTDGTTGQQTVFLEIFNPETGEHEKVQLRVGDETHDYRLETIDVETKRALLRDIQSGAEIVARVGQPAGKAGSQAVPSEGPPAEPGTTDGELIRQLRDEDWWLRQVAAQQIGHLGPMDESERSGWVRYLITTLKDEDPRVQAAAAEALGKLGDPRAIKHLVAALKEDEPVRSAAAEALAKFEPEQTLDLLKLALADEKNEAVRIGAVEALRRIPPDAALPLLVETLKTSQFTGQDASAIIESLVQISPEQALPAMVELAASGAKDPGAAAMATHVIGRWDSAPAREALINLAQNTDAPARAAALDALGHVPGQEVTDLLVSQLADPAWHIRVAAAKALEQRNYFPETAEAKARYYVPLENWDAVRNLGEAAIEPLIVALSAPATRSSERRTIRPIPTTPSHHDGFSYRLPAAPSVVPAVAAIMLAEVGAMEATEPIASLLEHESADARAAAAAALLILNNPQAAPALIQATRDPDTAVRYNAMQALGRLNTPEAVEAIAAALQDPDAKLREAAAQALGTMKADAAVEPLSRALNDVNEIVADRAMMALSEIGTPDAVEVVAAFLAPEKNMRWRMHAADRLGKMGPGAIPHLVEALDDPEVQIQEQAMHSLGEIGDPAPIDAVAAFLAPEKREQWGPLAVETLGNLGPEAIPHLEKLLSELESQPDEPRPPAPSVRPVRPVQPIGPVGDAAQRALEKLKQEQEGQAPAEPQQE